MEIGNALDQIKDKVLAVQTFKEGEGTGGWTTYNPTWPDDYNTLSELTQGLGYWIKVSSDCTLTCGNFTWQLKAGWNLIGWTYSPLDTDYLNLSKDDFKLRLSTGEIENYWWVFNRDYRIELAKRIFRVANIIPNSNYSWLAYKVNGVIDEANKKKMACTAAAMINTAKLSNGYPPGYPVGKWRDDMYYGVPGSWISFIPEVYLHVGTLVHTAVYEFYPGHSGLAIQIDKDIKKKDSFHFFELYAETIGIRVGKMTSADWTKYTSTPIATWEKENGIWVYKGEG
jgi:hypothetical protein